MATDTPADTLIDTAIDLATSAWHRITAMPRDTDDDLRARRGAMHREGLAVRKTIEDEIAPALRARPEGELMSLDIESIESRWSAAQGHLGLCDLCDLCA